ncbi:MAG: ATP synthase subunit I [Deltaproteobacteria bacterium]|nr:ATP synthase subunit I [Deltaproteobacteria bacterium]
MQTLRYLLIFMLGTALGTVYFAGLWYTVRRLPDTGAPLMSLLWSYLLRASMAVAGFGLAMQGGWEELIAALAGFILTREILLRRLGRNTS